MNFKVGDKVKFKQEKQRYTVRACNDRFLICTKPFNVKKTYLYTIVDLEKGIRGADNYYCRFDYLTESEEALKLLIESTLDKEERDYDFYISGRRRIKLDLE